MELSDEAGAWDGMHMRSRNLRQSCMREVKDSGEKNRWILTRERKARSMVEERLVVKKMMPLTYSSSRRKTSMC